MKANKEALSYEDKFNLSVHRVSSSLLRLAVEADAEISKLKAAIEYATDYLDEDKLNSIGHGSKAHRELSGAIKEKRYD